MHSMFLRCSSSIALACLVATPVLAAGADLPELIYSPWMKYCLGDTCFIGRDGHRNVIGPDNRATINCGAVVSALLIERSGDDKKALRVTLPPGVNRERGARIAIDQSEPVERPYIHCFAERCTAEIVGGPELHDQVKRGHSLLVGAIDKTNSPINVIIPLAGFADAYEGPSQETKVYEKVYHSKEEMQEDVERGKRAAEERKAWCEAR